MTHRILFVEGAFGFGGSVVALARLLRVLPRNEFDPFVVVRLDEQARYLREAAGAPFPIVVEPIDPPIDPGTGLIGRIRGAADHLRRHADHGRRVLARIRESSPALIHLNNGLASNYGAARVAVRTGLPVVVKQHGYEWHSADVRRLSRRIAHFMPDSEHVARDLEAVGVPRDRMTVTYCPVDLSEYRRPANVAAVRRELGLPLGAPVAAMTGMMIRWKGQHVFVDAMAHVLEDVPEAWGVVVGGRAGDADPEYPDELREQADRLGIAGRVVFAGMRDDVPRVLQSVDVCVHASTKPEPFGMVVAEAMAAGRPVVASAAGGPVEQIEDGESGFLVPPSDAATIADRLVRVMRDPALGRRLGARAREVVTARFSAERHASITADVYRRALALSN